MTYVLEDIGLEIREAIIKDASKDEIIHSLLSAAAQDNAFPEARAVDHESGHYLFSAPTLMKPDSLDRFYLAFVDGSFFYFHSEGQSGDGFVFLPWSAPGEKFKLVVSEISKAFSVYGRWGSGPLNKRGKPTYAVVPNFREVTSHGN